MYRCFIKRTLDIVFSAAALLLLSPLALICILAVRFSDGGAAIFRQERLGVGGKVFTMYKFRSMSQGAEKTGSGVYSEAGDPRVTKVGRLLRATSFDELPQLINILKGDMSFVGPRPALTYHPWTFNQYSAEQKPMFSVRPGITGWAQVNGRKAVAWPKRIELNVWYAENMSFKLDLKILFMTVGKVLRNSDNVNRGGTA